MIRRPALLFATALAVLSIRPEPSSAQTGWELNVHGATLLDDLFPESGGSIQAGARLVHTTPWRLTVGGNFDWVRTQEVALGGTADVSADLLLFSGEIGYAAPVSPRTDLMLAAGAGTASVRLYDVPPGASLLEESSGLLIPVGVGVRFRNRPEGATWAVRADVRDQVIFLDVVDPASGDVDPEPRHNWELSAGLSLLFGGRRAAVQPVVDERPAAPPPGPPPAEPRERPEREDADQDGVPDRLDRCVRTPTQLAVGPTGCPIDMDRDGNPDPRAGQAPVRPPAAEPDVREETPPPRPRPEAVDADRDGVPE
ncbi:MAG TPA: outer membrane beta-barrel protein, partial [Gemmatimonadota bacterium]|nr:outer membrane beta-barrel protein [Gemmatimonadota bacterium]